MPVKIQSLLKDATLIILGILSASIGLKGFLLSSKFIDGGVTGISMLVADITHLPIATLIFLINLPFLYMGYRRLGSTFAIKSALAITGFSLCPRTGSNLCKMRDSICKMK